MVRRYLRTVAVGAAMLGGAACARDRDMPDTVELPDTMPVVRAMDDAAARDAMLDTMPGGEMARGDSSAATRLLHDKMQH